MACTTTLTSISTSCGANLASIKKLWIGGFESATFTYDVETGVGPDGTDVIEDVKTAVLKANEAAWVEFAFKKNTSELTSELTVNDNGSHYYTNSVNLVFAKIDNTKRLAIEATASGECSMIVLDNNGQYWLIGGEVAVTATSMSATTGVAVGDSNQYSLTLSADESQMPVVLDPTNVDTIISALTV
jgi:hypothetical protein